MHSIVGRRRELDTLNAFLRTESRETFVLALEGDAGVGKSTLENRSRAGIVATAFEVGVVLASLWLTGSVRPNRGMGRRVEWVLGVPPAE